MSKTIVTKICSHCKEIKPLSEFYKNPHYKDGHICECKICYLKRVKEYSQTDKGKAKIKEYRQSKEGKAAQKRHRKTEKRKISTRRHKQTEKFKATQKRYNQSENRKESLKYYYSRNPERHKARIAVKHAIDAGKLPRPDTLHCACDNPAKQYHHHKGYEPKHWLDVIPVCIPCHSLLKLS